MTTARRPRLVRNIAANLIGRGFTVVLGLFLPPYFAKWLGTAAYGLVGFFAVLSSVFSLFDAGMAAVLERQLARLSKVDGNEREMRDLLRTFAAFYWGIGLVSALACYALAPLLADHWFDRGALPRDTVIRAVRLMGLVLSAQWPQLLYTSTLAGLQRQVAQNVLQSAASVARALTCVGVLVWVSTDISAYFLAQLAVMVPLTLALGAAAWSALGGVRGPKRFRLELLLAERSYGFGSWAIALSGMAITQLDKTIVSKTLPLSQLGLYSFPATASGALYMLIQPVFAAAFPRLTQLADGAHEPELARTYHATSQAAAVVLGAPSFVLCLFASEVLHGWMRTPFEGSELPQTLVLLTIGTTLHGLCFVPYALMLAHGWTSLSLRINAVLLVLLTPLEWLLASRYGMRGAALGWVIVGTTYFFLSVPMMHTRILKAERARWYLDDSFKPMAAAGTVVLLARWLLPLSSFRITLFMELGFVAAAAATAAALSATHTRAFVDVRARQAWQSLATRRSAPRA